MQLPAGKIQSLRAAKTVKHVLRRATARGLFSVSMLAAATQLAYGGAEFKIGDDASLSLGIGLRTSFTSRRTVRPTASIPTTSHVENVRLYINGQYGKYLKATFNTERTGGPAATGGDGVRVMDAIAQFEPDPAFNVWLGRMLPPSDRANLDGPFYLMAWSYPGVISNYPQLAVGRDNGAMVWGKPMAGKVVYSVGAFNGHNRVAGLSNESDRLLYAGRLAVNFWDAEPAPAYYTGSTYYGGKDILTLALVGQTQSNGVGTAAAPASLKIWNADLLIEKKLAGGLVPTLEGAYYKYDLAAGLIAARVSRISLACRGAADNVGGQVAGKAYLASAALLFPTKVGWGQFQPFIRYQKFNRDVSATSNRATDFGLNYIIKGPNAKISAVYTKFDDSRRAPGTQGQKQFLLGVQLQKPIRHLDARGLECFFRFRHQYPRQHADVDGAAALCAETAR